MAKPRNPRTARLLSHRTGSHLQEGQGVTSRVSLNMMQDRIRRLFGMAGEIPVTFTPHVSISLDAGSLLAPGMNVLDGRRWMTTLNLTDPGVIMAALRATTPSIVDSVFVQCSPTVQVSLLYAASDVAPIAGLSNNVLWVENGTLSADRAPLLGAGLLGTGSAVGTSCSILRATEQGVQMIATPIHLPQNAQLCIVTGAAASTFGRVTISGTVQEGV